jgi:hypothetical protein
MRRDRVWTKLEGMDTLISFWPLVVALIPLAMALRAVATDGPKTSTSVSHENDGYRTAFPSLATLKDMEDTAPMFVKRSEWWSEEGRHFCTGDLATNSFPSDFHDSSTRTAG